jgi:RNA polymerase sigma-70 factor, ECF subfamily
MGIQNDNNNEQENITKTNTPTKIDLTLNVKMFKEKTGQDFDVFYNKYHPKLVYYAAKYCGSEEEAYDYADESFISALEKINSYDSEKAGFSTWLFVIARNHVFQNIKKSKRLPTVSIDTSIDEDGSTIKDFISNGDEEIEILTENENLIETKSKIMIESINKLKKSYRSVINMREVEKMTYREIANELGTDQDMNLMIESTYVELPQEISEVFELKNNDGNDIEYTLSSNSADGSLYTHIRLSDEHINSQVYMKARVPQNLSTVKSKIRNGRLKLQEMVKDKFKRLDKINYKI